MATRENIGELLEAAGLLDLPAAELGVWKGQYSSQILGWGVSFLYLIDLWGHDPNVAMGGYPQDVHDEALAECEERVAQHDGEVKFLRGYTHEMAAQIPDGTLGFCFVDASHDYENVLRDLNCYWPKLVDNGMMAGHDYPQAGVKQAVGEFAEKHNLKIHVLPIPGDPNDATFWLERS